MPILMANSRHDLVLRFAGAPEFLDVDPEAAISVDGAGRITGMTHGGARLLANSGGVDWRSPERLIGQPVTDFFDARLDELASLTRASLPQDRRIAVRDGSLLYAHAIEPQQRVSGVAIGRAVSARFRPSRDWVAPCPPSMLSDERSKSSRPAACPSCFRARLEPARNISRVSSTRRAACPAASLPSTARRYPNS